MGSRILFVTCAGVRAHGAAAARQPGAAGAAVVVLAGWCAAALDELAAGISGQLATGWRRKEQH